jgi:poly(A) polymerase
VFPATARVLGAHAPPYVRSLLEQTLASTDERVRADKPVTPAFLFAAMLWEPVRQAAQAMIAEGVEPMVAWAHASDRILREQAQRVAIPRRFTITIEEIWALQLRFAQRTKKRAFRLLEHPRFRAAYDFLLLRADESPELAELAQWWTEAQQVDQAELVNRLAAVPATPEEAPPKSKRKRARRRRRKARSGGDATVQSDAGE